MAALQDRAQVLPAHPVEAEHQVAVEHPVVVEQVHQAAVEHPVEADREHPVVAEAELAQSVLQVVAQEPVQVLVQPGNCYASC